jgi:hypothetical protein
MYTHAPITTRVPGMPIGAFYPISMASCSVACNLRTTLNSSSSVDKYVTRYSLVPIKWQPSDISQFDIAASNAANKNHERRPRITFYHFTMWYQLVNNTSTGHGREVWVHTPHDTSLCQGVRRVTLPGPFPCKDATNNYRIHCPDVHRAGGVNLGARS